MTSTDGVREDVDVDAVVLARFRDYLGFDDVTPEDDLLNDLGMDSIGLVTILLDLADELALDLASERASLARLYTLGDVTDLVRALYRERPGAG